MALSQIPHLSGASWTPHPASYPNTLPSHAGLDGASFVLVAEQREPCFLKLYHEGELGFEFESAVAATRQSGQGGFGPALIDADATLSAVVTHYWGAPWRTASALDLDATATRLAAVDLLRRWHDAPLLGLTPPSPSDLANQVEGLLGERLGLLIPAWGALRVWVERIAAMLAAADHDSVPLHREVFISNLLVGPGNELALVDFDHAADGDGYADLAALALDVCELDGDYDVLVEAYAGTARRDLIARTKLHVLLEDFRWGCVTLLQHSNAHRRGMADFLSYSRLRLGRCLAHLNSFDVATLLGDLR